MSDTKKPADDELDTEGQAFKWILVEDEKGKQRLKQTYEPDDPKSEARRSPARAVHHRTSVADILRSAA